MGAKSAIKLRKRSVAFKCNSCGRKLMSSKALVAHQRNAHNVINIATSPRRGRPPKTHEAVKLDKAFSKNIETEIATPSNCPPKLKATAKYNERVEFECPKCFKRFPTYFPAKKHIQKYHCVDTQNYVVSPRDPNLIKPVRLELCTKCMQKVKLTEAHECVPEVKRAHECEPEVKLVVEEDPLKQNNEQRLLLCAACELWFPNSTLFNSHVMCLHAEPVESMFFPNITEYTKWKIEMEHLTKASFSVLEQDLSSSKQHYLCSFRRSNPGRPNTSYVCPSTIVVQQFPNGIQVHFHQKHYKHSVTEYKMPLKYKKYSITPLLKSSQDYKSLVHLKSDEDDLYMQFKSLMEGIVVDAAKINIATLKIILGKALEITSILSNYDEELDDVPIRDPRKILLQDQITKSSQDTLSKIKAMDPKAIDPVNITATVSGNLVDTKRKKTNVETIPADVPEKRPKLEDNLGKTVNKIGPSPKIVNSFSLADAAKMCKNAKVVTENIAVDTNTKVNKVSDEPKSDKDSENKLKVNGEPSSFADSYKDFVVKNFPNMESVASRTRSKPILKTRIGEFKPSDAKTDEKSKPVPIQTKSVDKSVAVSTNIVADKTNLLQKALEQNKPLPISMKFVNNKTKSVAVSTNTVENKTDLLRKALEQTNLVQTPTRFADNKAKSVSFSPKIVDDKPNPVSVSTKVIVDKTKVLPRIDVKIGTDLQESPNTRGKSQYFPTKMVETQAKVVDRKNPRASFDKPKVDLDYEVKERADDCNILILKI